MTPPATSSLLSIHRNGRLSRAHVERFGTELARRHADGAGLGYAGNLGRLLRNAFLHEGQLILRSLRGDHGAREDSSAALSDVASAVRELELLGERTLANFFLAAWLEQSGAFEQLASLRAHLRRDAPVRPGSLIILHGLSGAGKTTLATALAGAIGALVVSNDVERIRSRRDHPAAAGGTGSAPPRLRDRLEQLAGHVIRAGWPAIVDSCFLVRADRERFRALAEALNAPFAILACAAPLPAIRARLDKRRAFGSLFHGTDADAEAVSETLAAQIDRTNALDERERAYTITVDTGSPVDHGRLASLLLERTQ